jgi:hypothetical protein
MGKAKAPQSKVSFNLSSFSKDTAPRAIKRSRSFASHRLGKRVTFQGDKGGSIIVRSHTYPAVPMDLLPELYWSGVELQSSHAIQRKEAKELASLLADCICHLHGYEEFDKETEAAKLLLAKSGCRGLEDCLTPLLKRRRLWAIQSILENQELNRCEVTDHQEFAMHACSESVSAASIRFARHLAEIDEVEAGGRHSLTHAQLEKRMPDQDQLRRCKFQ